MESEDEICANCFFRLISNNYNPACYKKEPIKVTALSVERAEINDNDTCDLFKQNGRMGVTK